LSWDEAHKLTANPDATASVLSWLKDNGVEVESVHKHGHFITAKTKVSTWEELLSTSFSRMTDEKSSPVLRATTDVSLPEDIAELVEGIFMTTQIPVMKMPSTSSAMSSGREASVLSWLKDNGVEVESVHKHGHFITAKTKVSTWEELLSTSFSRMTDEKSSPVLRATTDVSLPEDIAELVEGIFMTTQIPVMNPPPIIKPVDPAENSDNDVTPAKIKSFYGVTGAGTASIRQSVYEGIGQTASPSRSSLVWMMKPLPQILVAMSVISFATSIPTVALRQIWTYNTCWQWLLDLHLSILMTLAQGPCLKIGS